MKIDGNIVRQLRQSRNWTQEHLASLIDGSVKTVQRVENSSVCGLETRAALCAVFGVRPDQLDGNARIEQAAVNSVPGNQASIHDALKDAAPDVQIYRRITTGADVVEIFNGCWWYNNSHEEPRSGDDVDAIASALQQIHDWAEIWGDIDVGDRVRATHEIGELLRELEASGMWLFGLRTRGSFKLPKRDGTHVEEEGTVANIHVAYANSDRIIALGPER